MWLSVGSEERNTHEGPVVIQTCRISPSKHMLLAHKWLNTATYVIAYRDESLLLIGMHNSCHSNYTLDTERVTVSVDNGHSCGD